MPLRKFRSVEEMEAGAWLPAGDPRLARAIRRVWAFGTRTLRPSFPPGLHRYRSVEAASAAAERWERERFEAQPRTAPEKKSPAAPKRRQGVEGKARVPKP